MYILIDEKNRVIAYAPIQGRGYIPYDGEMPTAEEGQHLEYREGKVVAVDGRIAEISAQRKQAYIQRVDPITAEISRLRDMGGTEDEIAEAMARRAEAVAAIKAEYPYPEEVSKQAVVEDDDDLL